MKTITATTAALILAYSAVALRVETPPGVQQCVPTRITYTEASGTVFIAVLPGGQSNALPLKTFPNGEGPSGVTPWTVDLAAGTEITLRVTDSTGTQAFSDVITIQPGGSDCLNGGPASNPASSGSAPSTTAAPATTAGSTTSVLQSTGASSVASSITSAVSSGASSVSSVVNSQVSSISSVISSAVTPNAAGASIKLSHIAAGAAAAFVAVVACMA